MSSLPLWLRPTGAALGPVINAISRETSLGSWFQVGPLALPECPHPKPQGAHPPSSCRSVWVWSNQELHFKEALELARPVELTVVLELQC